MVGQSFTGFHSTLKFSGVFDTKHLFCFIYFGTGIKSTILCVLVSYAKYLTPLLIQVMTTAWVSIGLGKAGQTDLNSMEFHYVRK